MKKILFITTNAYKFSVAQKALESSQVELEQKALDYEVPEIQGFEVEEIAKWSASWVAEKLNEPVAVTDAGYYINSLNGFPGPYIKFINKWLNAGDILRLMDGKEDRSIEVRETLAYCEPGSEPIAFNGVARGTIALKRGTESNSPINELFIPEGSDRPMSEIEDEVMQKFWGDKLNNWIALGKYF